MSEPTVPKSPDKMPTPGEQCDECSLTGAGGPGRVFHPQGRPHGTTIALLALALLFLSYCLEPNVAAAPPVMPGTGRSTEVAPTRAAQAQLRSYGYTIAVDGIAGPQTARIVTLWQRSNALPQTGVLDQATVKSLRIATTATSTRPAVRLDPPAPPPVVDMTVEQIIRDVWPTELADWAVRIATRESRLVPTVRNSCCWGLFQMNWGAHHAWLTADYGITDPHQLLDARTNATVALALYQATGPGPWQL